MSGAGQHGRSASQIRVADGYMTLGSRDGYMYVFGKGKSITTVTAPDVTVAQDDSFMIKGTVLDMSPAQPGTPCVSKDSMTLQMEHLHLQQPIGGIFGNETITGVPVSLDAVDPNGNNIHIDIVTSDGYSGTFSYTWTPEIPGDYTITATFMGDGSYGSSFATTYASVVEADAASPTASPVTFDAVNNTIIAGLAVVGIAIIIAIAIAVPLILRKRP